MTQQSVEAKYVVKSVLLMDDEVAICDNMAAFFEDYGYEIATAHNGAEGLAIFNANPTDLVIVDLHMPVMSGHDVLLTLSASHPEVPIIVVSGVGAVSEAMETVAEGAWDFVSKPLHDFNVLLYKIKQVEEKVSLIKENRNYKEHLEQLVEARTADVKRLNLQLIKTQKEVVARLADMIETRCSETGNHVRRVAYISRLLAQAYGLGPLETEVIRMASPLHDVGKIGICDAILNKEGRLTAEEFEQIKHHSDIGYNLLKTSEQEVLQAAAIIANQHHERWDGSGYPHGIKGENIHIYGRITCLADVYDALRQKRHYKDAWGMETAIDFVKENSGVFFEPKLVELFLQNIDEIEEIISTYQQPDAVI